MHRQPWWSREVDGFLILNGYTTTTRATTLRTPDVYFVFIHLREIAGAFAEIPQCSLICRCYLYFTYRSYLFTVLVLSMNCRALFQLLDSFNEGPQKGLFNPTILTKINSQSRSPDGLYRPILISILQFCLGPFSRSKRAPSLGDGFLNQLWSIKIYGHRRT